MGGVRMYGSLNFTPNDIPAGDVFDRADFTFIWAGCLGSGSTPPCGSEHVDTGLRSATAWSFGGYGCSDFINNETCNDCNTPTGAGCMPQSLQDEGMGTGWNSFLNANGINKRVVAIVGTDLPAGTTITYVRVWIRGGSFEGTTKKPQPFWQFNDGAGSGAYPAVSSGTQWDPGNWSVSSSTYNLLQASSKWTTNPSATQPWTPALMASMGWGVRHGPRGAEGNPGAGTINISEMGVEVGYASAVQYTVTTGPALSVTGTAATLTGSVNPFGDASGSFFFQYGTNTALGSATAETPQPLTTLYSVSVDLAGLTSDTTYYYRLVARDSTGTLRFGQTLNFLTVSSCSTRSSLVGG